MYKRIKDFEEFAELFKNPDIEFYQLVEGSYEHLHSIYLFCSKETLDLYLEDGLYIKE